MALAPRRCAWARKMSKASARAVSHMDVSMTMCPPKSVSIFAPMVPMMERERTVTPRTTPSDCTTR